MYTEEVFSLLVSSETFESQREMVEILHNRREFSTRKLMKLLGEEKGKELSVKFLAEVINHVYFSSLNERRFHVFWAEDLLQEILDMHPHHEIHMAEVAYMEYLFNQGLSLGEIKKKIFANQKKQTPV